MGDCLIFEKREDEEVGYEQDESLTTALHVGFTTLGPLRVWIKEG